MLPRLKILSVEDIVNYAPASTALAALGFLAIYSLKAIVMVIPVTILYIAAGVVFPTGWAFIITYLCLTAALSIGYINGKRLGEEKVNQVLAKQRKVSEFLSGRKDNLSSLCFISRILPLPFDLLSMFCGALGMPYIKFIFVSLLGLSPAAIPYVYAGASVSDPLSPEFLVPFGVSLLITLVVFTIYKRQTAKKAA
jgi:uncharacterized membrane protein YdjX (TVP38/TMEM64 family)